LGAIDYLGHHRHNRCVSPHTYAEVSITSYCATIPYLDAG
jgi:hypothetical protein